MSHSDTPQSPTHTGSEVLPPEQLRRDVAEALGTDPAGLSDTEDLIRRGLDSITIMTLSSTWLAAGVDVRFSDLLQRPTLAAWHALVSGRSQVGADRPPAPRPRRPQPPAVPRDSGAPFALTPVQHAYWIGRQDGQVLGGVSCHSYVEFDGPALDPGRLERAIRELTSRHEMLRARFLPDGTQQVVPHSSWAGLRVHRLTGGEDETRHALAELREQLSHRRLEVSDGHVFDVQLSVLPGGTSRLHVNLDMLVVDVRSMRILFDDLARAYDQAAPEAARIGYTFAQYLTDRGDRSRTARERDRAFWADRIPSLPGAPALPLAIEPAQLERPHFTHRTWWLPAERWQPLVAQAHRRALTPSMVLLTAFCEVLATWSAESRFLVNLPLFDRRHLRDDVAHMVADFTDLVLLAVDTADDVTFAQRVARIQDQFRVDVAHMEYSGVEVLRDLARVRGEQIAAPVVFASTLGMHGFASTYAQRVLGDLTYRASQTPQVWLDHQVVERDGGVALDWYVVEELFPPGVVPAMFMAYVDLVEWLSAGAGTADRWSRPAPDLLPADQAATRRAVNRSGPPVEPAVLHGGFFERARSCPSAPALVWGESGSLSYGTVARRARQVAALLASRGVAAGDRVAVSLPKGADQIVAVLGVLCAGGVYVPVGVDQPAARSARMYASADVRVVLTGPGFGEAARRDAGGGEWPACVDVVPLAAAAAHAEAPVWPTRPVTTPGDEAAADQTAYVVFTSGSTGEPKGVMVSHRAAWNTVAEVCARFDVTAADRVLAVSALDFDLSVFDVFGMLSTGGAVVLIADEDQREASRWLALMQRWRVTVWNSVPALMEMALSAAGVDEVAGDDTAPAPRAGLASLRLVLVSGDWVRVDLADRLRTVAHGARVVALGGATEAAVWSNAFEMTQAPADWVSVPYGWPLRGQAFRVVDPRGRDCPDWVAGELWIGGAGLAQGYAGDPVRTADRFVCDGGRRWYRTGDLGRYRPGGILEFLGRRDTQVKVRGHRIELGEIEAGIQSHPAVARAAVVAVADGRRLAAAVVPADGGQAGLSAAGDDLTEPVRQWLEDLLPAHMIPDRVVAMADLPLTATGKVDRATLGQLLQAPATARAQPPRDGVESEVARLWSETIGVALPNRDDNFFVLGGDSLHATRLVTRLRAAGLVGAEIATLFAFPALADFAAQLHHGETRPAWSVRPDPAHRYEPFEPTEVQRAYWIGRRPGIALGGVAPHWYAEYDVPDLDVTRLERAMDRLIERHDMLRAVFDDDGRQRVLPEVPPFRVHAVDAVDVDDAGAASAKLREAMSHQVLDPSRWPLFDIRVVRCGPQSRVAFSFDNIILDALSIMTVFHELSVLYRNPDADLPAVGLTFREYRTQITHTPAALTDAKAYWAARLADLPPAPALPLVRDPAVVERPRFVRHQAWIPAAQWQAIVAEARRQELTPSMVLAAAYADVISAWSGDHEFTLNLTLFDRREVHPDINRVLGDFTSLLLVACRPSGARNWLTGARALQEEVWSGLQHSEVSAVDLLRDLTRARGTPVAAPVVFTSALGVAGPTPDDAAPDVFADQVWGVSQTPQVWLDHQVIAYRGGVVLNWDAAAELFSPAALASMFEAYTRLVRWLADSAATSGWSGPAPDLVAADQPEPRAAASMVRQTAPEHSVEALDDTVREPPRGDVERTVARVWSEILDVALPNRHDNFFVLGGDSLHATRLVRELSRRYGREVTLRELFATPTVAGCAALFDDPLDEEEGSL